MKFLDTPPPQDFDLYIARPDTRWILHEPGDKLTLIYQSGFLPYSGAANLQNVFYSARSARIALKEFELTSENRRIAKKFDGHFICKRVPAAQFNINETFFDFCLNYFAQKHSPRAMPRARVETILNSGLISNVLIYQTGHKPVAYVLEVEAGGMGHYWFSFYNLSFANQSLGLWLMLDALRQAKARGLEHYYLGTVYGTNALYKTNFEPLEWWGGGHWSRDSKLLKELSRGD